MTCDCEKYAHLELTRGFITSRIRESARLKRRLTPVARDEGGEHELLACPECGQAWQASRAWSCGDGEYLFRVPEIPAEDWLAEPYVRPDELMAYNAAMSGYFRRQSFVEKDEPCRAEGCAGRAIELSVFCLEHHIESLTPRALPAPPGGRWFPPYRPARPEGGA